MASKKVDYPIFLSGHPTGEDKFEGKSHERIAFAVSELIRKDRIKKKVIGLEGEWGSGKSNVIEMVKKVLGNDYYCFIFDAWGNQEDLTRRTFLEEIIDELFDKGYLKDEKKWTRKKNELLAKKSTTIKSTVPRLKPFWVFFIISFFSFAVLSGLFDIYKDVDLIKSIDLKSWKPVLWSYLIPTGLFIWGVYYAIKQYIELWKDNKNKTGPKEDWLQLLGKLFYWVNGDEMETEELENIIEDEPTVKQFRSYFEDIQKDLKKNKKGLIIVFDNLDRLDKEKVKALWSSIHTFFAERTYDNTWVVVPYYKEKLIELFDDDNSSNAENGNGFIEKTFTVNFRVAPPVVTDWEGFMKDKLKEAFGDKLLKKHKEEEDYIVTLFDRLNPGSTIKPREIINYINQIVALYHQWDKEIVSGELKLRYLSLYTLIKDQLHENPLQTILNLDNKIGTAFTLFTHDSELEDCLSALVFNVSKEKAGEVLLKRQLTSAIREGKVKEIENLKKHPAFARYFQNTYDEIKYGDKKHKLRDILECLEGSIPKSVLTPYWSGFALNYDIDKELTEDVKAILKHTTNYERRALITRYVKSLTSDFEKTEQQITYFKQIGELKAFLIENNIDFDLHSVLTNVNVHPEVLLNIVSEEKAEYKKLKLSCPNDMLQDYFFDQAGGVLNIELVVNNLEALEYIRNDFDLEYILIETRKKLASIQHNEHDIFKKCLKILNVLASKPLNVKLSSQFYANFTIGNIGGILTEAVAIGLGDFEASAPQGHIITTIQNIDDAKQEAVSQIIGDYISFNDFIKLLVEKPNSRKAGVKGIFTKWLDSETDLQFDPQYALIHFDEIATVLEHKTPLIQQFIEKLNGQEVTNELALEEIFNDLPANLFNYTDNTDLIVIKRIVEEAVKYVNERLTKEQILSSLKEHDRSTEIILSLIENEQISKFSEAFYAAYEEYLSWFIVSEEEIPDEDHIVTKLYNSLDGRVLKGIYTRLKDEILKDHKKYAHDKLAFALKSIIKHSNLNKDPEIVAYKLVAHIFDHQDLVVSVFEPHNDFFIEMIKSSGDYIEDARTKLTANIALIQNAEIREKVINELGLNIQSQEDEENEENAESKE